MFANWHQMFVTYTFVFLVLATLLLALLLLGFVNRHLRMLQFNQMTWMTAHMRMNKLQWQLQKEAIAEKLRMDMVAAEARASAEGRQVGG